MKFDIPKLDLKTTFLYHPQVGPTGGTHWSALALNLTPFCPPWWNAFVRPAGRHHAIFADGEHRLAEPKNNILTIANPALMPSRLGVAISDAVEFRPRSKRKGYNRKAARTKFGSKFV